MVGEVMLLISGFYNLCCLLFFIHVLSSNSQGGQFLYSEDWGEALVKKEHPVVCILDLPSGDVTVLEDELLNDYSSGMVSYFYNR